MNLQLPYNDKLCEKHNVCFNLFHEHPDAILIIKDNKIIDCNDSAIKMFKFESKSDLLGNSPFSLSPLVQENGEHSSIFGVEMIEKAMETGYNRFEWLHKQSDGIDLYTEITLVAKKIKTETIISAIIQDITDRKNKENEISFLYYKDALTGLDNKESFRNNVEKELIKADNDKNIQSGVLFLDINEFKNINDNLGHFVGDEILKAVAKKLRQNLGNKYCISRYVGDQFAIFVNNIDATEDLIAVGKDVLRIFRNPFTIDKHSLYLTASIGMSTYPEQAKDYNSLIKNSNIAMNQAKKAKGIRIEVYNNELTNKLQEKFIIDKNLRFALQKNELYLNYQPIVDTETESIIGVEALIRWQNDELGFVPPDKFIYISENNGMIIPIGNWVLETACKQLKKWHSLGYKDMFMSVNVSIKQLEQRYFMKSVRKLLEDLDLEAKYLTLEVTESVYMENLERIYINLKSLKDLGISISIDDFGTGYSSLSKLRELEICKLKIDRSFIKDIHTDINSTKIVSAIIAMAKSLHLNVIAEGVEYQDHLVFLKNEGCDMLQGYLFSKPISCDEIENLLCAKK